ncbi:MAG: recombinase family protein [Parvularculaceae bacterium]
MIKRCAIYTRKSTEEGLDQAFNSLDAQREASESYIASQRHEGWRAIATRFDDGGHSGGTMERPALKALLAEIDADRVDIVIVYKVDRLTRSLADFAKLVERFDAHNVSFVSVTQQFNTSNSMGRLTLNVLLSFAQFEREVGAERVRDKIAASRKKGIWTGGNPPLGYDNIDKKLVVNEGESKVVREIFALFQQNGSVREIIRIASAKGWTTKPRANGTGGQPLTRGPLYHILKNPIYAGLIRGGADLYEGKQEAIISRAQWEAVQHQLLTRTRWSGESQASVMPLCGKLTVDGARMMPSHTTKGGKRHRYYIADPRKDAPRGERLRLNAHEVETAVQNALQAWLSAPQSAAELLNREFDARDLKAIAEKIATHARILTEAGAYPLRQEVGEYLEHASIDKASLAIRLSVAPLLGDRFDSEKHRTHIEITSPIALLRRGQNLRLILGDCETAPNPDRALVELLMRAHRWKTLWFENAEMELKEIIKRDGGDPTTAHRIIRLAFLAPDLQESILNGTAPTSLTPEVLRRMPDLPPSWPKQREMLEL